MNKYLSLIFCIFSLLPVAAQRTDSITILGWPKDAFTIEPLIDGTRVELLNEDSTLLAETIPTWDERVRGNSCFTFKLSSRTGTYIIRVSHDDYQTLVKKFTIKLGKREYIHSLGLLKLRRKPAEKVLGEATVTATKIKFYTRGDTLIYNADAFNLAEGSMLDALVRQFPGARLERDGRIFVNGKQVESLLLNGKDFFKGDNNIMLDNLPAYTVQNVKFYDKQSEMSEMMGRKVDDGSFVMDVSLKRQYQIGWLGNVEAGGGTHSRWLGRLFALRFTPQSRISVYANANNTHESRKPGQGGDWTPGDIGYGTSTTARGGMDYMVKDKLGRFEVSGELSAAHTDTDTELRQAGERFMSNGNSFSRSWNTGNTKVTELSTGHRFRFNLGPENSPSSTMLNIHPNFKYYHTRNAGQLLSAEFSEDPKNIAGLLEALQGPRPDESLLALLVNRVRSEQRANTTAVDGGASADFYFRIPLTEDGLSLSAAATAGHRTDRRHDLYNLNYSTATDHRRRFYDTPNDHIRANAGVGWSHSLDSEWRWLITPRLDYSYSHTRQENALYRLDLLEEMAGQPLGTLPSTREALLSALDGANSYITTHDTHGVSLYLRGRYDKEVRVNGQRHSRLRLTWNPSLTLQSDSWNFDGIIQRTDRRTAWLPALELELLRNTPGMKHELEIIANYRQQLPSMFTLMGMRFDSDPLNISEGNAGLHRTDICTLKGTYRSDQWLSAKKRMLSATARLNIYRNAVAMGQTYDATTGARTYRPENVNGNWGAEARLSFSTPIGRRRLFTLQITPTDYFHHSVDLSAATGAALQRSTVRTNYLQLPVTLEFNRNRLRVGLKAQAAWNHAESAREDFRRTDAADISYGLFGSTALPWNLQLATDLTLYTRHGYSSQAMNGNDLVWNAQISKSVLANRLTFALIGYDILGQLSNITYTLNSQAAVETWRNVIPRYAMIRVIYRLNKQPKKK